ncbi:MAG TPA: FkbM family methyltransferase [Planctomycetota bacterium]|nr:FkbM family methyltransferase [Planctomycetota bacterium]
MTAVLAARVSPGGTVWSFEAHPEIHRELCDNVELLRGQLPATDFHPIHRAVSTGHGVLNLRLPQGFEQNRGLASVATGGEGTVEVVADPLDELLDGVPIGVMKIDVEGHELQVLRGSERILREGNVRDCVFEEHATYPTEVTRSLESHGFRIFRIARQFRGPVLLAPDSAVPRSTWEPTSFLATRQPERAIERLAVPGWRSLKGVMARRVGDR